MLEELHKRDFTIMHEILERERKNFESECGIVHSNSASKADISPKL